MVSRFFNGLVKRSKQRRLAVSNDSTLCAGIDIGDRYCQIVVLDESGEVSEQSRIRTTPTAFKHYFQSKSPMRIAMEVGTHSPWLGELLNYLGHEALVGNACKLRLIHRNNQKSDEVDAELLARLCRFDPQLLYPICHKGQEARAAMAVIRTRDALVRSRTLLINHARGIVKPTGYRLSKCSSRYFSKLHDEVPESLRPVLEPILHTVDQLSVQIQAYGQQIENIGQDQYPQAVLLQEVSGVGPITALTFVLTIGDPWRFAHNRDIGAYLGLVPRRSQTGQSDPELSITKAGNRYLRNLLVQCSHYILGPFGPDSNLRRSGERIASHGGKNAKKRARVAVARRLAVMLLSMLKTGESYAPLRGSHYDEVTAA
jgi:transposase